jgi:prolyl-tRNA synthetase
VCVLARRDTRDKETVPLAELGARAAALLETQQAALLAKATAERNACIATITQWKDFVPALDAKKMVLAPWCEDPESEEWAKKKSGEESEAGGAAKTLCIPFEQPPLPAGTLCFTGNGKPATCWALWGRSY